jgi:hypothetical protein
MKLEKKDYTESDDLVTCKLPSGLACNNEQQSDGLCEDYTIRVFCTCEGQLQCLRVIFEDFVTVLVMGVIIFCGSTIVH